MLNPKNLKIDLHDKTALDLTLSTMRDCLIDLFDECESLRAGVKRNVENVDGLAGLLGTEVTEG